MRTAVIVFAKLPRSGQVKTRLAPALGADGAARLAARMLCHAVAQAQAAGVGPVALCLSPDADDPTVQSLARNADLALTLQGEGDLGARMHRALERALEAHPAALLMGTDAPTLDAVRIRQAAAALRTHDAVFAPTADGGYALVGLRRPVPSLFLDQRWSHDRVMADAREHLLAAGLRHVELPLLYDVDEPADLVHVPAAWLDDLQPGPVP
jgi:uncharacterized protein